MSYDQAMTEQFDDPYRVVTIPAIEIARIVHELRGVVAYMDATGLAQMKLEAKRVESIWADLLNLTGVDRDDYPQVQT